MRQRTTTNKKPIEDEDDARQYQIPRARPEQGKRQ